MRKEDFAIGLEITITSILLLVSDTLKYATKVHTETLKGELLDNNKLIAVPWILLVIIIGLWGTSTLIRKFGWKTENDMHWWWGITFPNIFGLLSLIFIVNWIND
jgi:hypothetical protein